MKLIVIWLGKIILFLTRLRGGGGSALPGLVGETLFPNFNRVMARQLREGSVLVTGTNGKTTTAKMLARVLEDGGKQVIRNVAGSNMSRGIASSFIECASWTGKLQAGVGLFEVDEAYVPLVASELKPKAIVVLNLLRDQLDRYGELDRAAQLIGEGLEHATVAILNQDDPLVAQLHTRTGGEVVTFGAAPALRAQVPHDAALLATLPKTAAKSPRTKPTALLTKANAHRQRQSLEIAVKGTAYAVELQLPGLYNAVNATAVLAAVQALGLDVARAAESLGQVTAAFGRTELVTVGEAKLQLLLVKNPAAFNQVIQTFLLEGPAAPVLIAINDKFADGRDVSWLWDVDFERLQGTKHVITASGVRGADMALRLKYAEVPCKLETDWDVALDTIIADSNGRTGYIIPTYTAMLELRKLLALRTDLPEVWE